MRRWLGQLLPVVVIALLVQVLAPVGAFRAMAQAVSDPLGHSAICSGLHDPADPAAPAGATTRDSQCCAFCAGAHSAAAALDPPVPTFVVLQRRYQRVAWLQRGDAPAPWRIGSNAQARAPPSVLI